MLACPSPSRRHADLCGATALGGRELMRKKVVDVLYWRLHLSYGVVWARRANKGLGNREPGSPAGIGHGQNSGPAGFVTPRGRRISVATVH